MVRWSWMKNYRLNFEAHYFVSIPKYWKIQNCHFKQRSEILGRKIHSNFFVVIQSVYERHIQISTFIPRQFEYKNVKQTRKPVVYNNKATHTYYFKLQQFEMKTQG